MPPRPISTLAIPKSTLFALSQAGYETTDELASSTPESLARGNQLSRITEHDRVFFLMGIPSPLCKKKNIELGISVQSSQQILSVGPRPPATQPAAALLDSVNDVFRSSPPINNLLGGGLRRGHVLELLGPPGTPKTTLILETIRDFIENREDVLIIGICLRFPCSVFSPCLSVQTPRT